MSMESNRKHSLVRLLAISVLACCFMILPLGAQDSSRGAGDMQSRSATNRHSFDDDSGSLAIHVIDAAGRELPNMVHVELFRGEQASERRPQQDGYCDSQGYYTFGGLHSGSYSVSVSVPGFLPQRYDVQLTTGDQQQVVVQMRQPAHASGVDSGSTVSVQQLGVPEKARKKYEKGFELYEHKDYKGAAKQLHEVLEVDSSYVLAQNQLGLTYWRMEKLDDARQWFETAMRTDPKFLLPYLNLAELLGQQNEYEKAAAVLKQASEAQPYQGEPYYLMAKIQLEAGDTERAEQAANQALKRDTSRIPEVHLLLANVYLRLHQLAKVASQLEAYLALAPQGLYAKAARENLQKIKRETAHNTVTSDK